MKNYLGLLFLGLAFTSCDNEVDVNAPYTETTVLYATLSTNNAEHYLRITRAYLGPDGITGGNNVGDSLYYDSLNVVLRGYDSNDQLQQTIVASRFTGIPLDPGFFTGDGYALYRVTGTMNEDYTYEVTIERPDGVNITARTPIVHDFTILDPRVNIPIIDVMARQGRGQEVRWRSAVNGRIYQAFLHFDYLEFPRNDPSDSVRHTVSYTMPYVIGDNTDGTQEIEGRISGFQFFSFLDNTLQAPPQGYVRLPAELDFEVRVGADDLATHIVLNQPSEGILQDPPFFTNVENGAGILSSTYTKFVRDKVLATASIDELVFGDLTCHLRFGKVTTTDTLYCQN